MHACNQVRNGVKDSNDAGDILLRSIEALCSKQHICRCVIAIALQCCYVTIGMSLVLGPLIPRLLFYVWSNISKISLVQQQLTGCFFSLCVLSCMQVWGKMPGFFTIHTFITLFVSVFICNIQHIFDVELNPGPPFTAQQAAAVGVKMLKLLNQNMTKENVLQAWTSDMQNEADLNFYISRHQEACTKRDLIECQQIKKILIDICPSLSFFFHSITKN